jgi:hypothetical protein
MFLYIVMWLAFVAVLLRLWARISPGHWCLSAVSVVCCQRRLRRANHSSRGVLPTVMRRFDLSRNLVKEESLAHWGLLRQNKKEIHSRVAKPNQATVEGSSGTNTMTFTGGSRYSLWNSWGWALWRPKHVEFDVAVNKCLHTDASSWSFLLIVAKLLLHVTKDSILKLGLRDPWLMSTRSVILTAYICFP